MMKPLQPVDRPQALHVSVQAALKSYIADNDLQAGDALPPEGELARQLGVSRNSVREGIKALESVGLVEVRRGIGIFVAAFSLEPLIENLPIALERSLRDVEEILELRRALEVSLIEKAMRCMEPKDLAELGVIITAMKERAACGGSFAEEDRRFHQQLFASLGNGMLLSLIEIFWLVFYRVSGFGKLDNPDPLATCRDHEEILAAVVAGDAPRARDCLDQHYAGIAAVVARWRAEATTA
jgi:DNA-binding FadR family transcriptional regulator